MSTKEQKEALATAFIEQHYQLYLQARNPIHLWRAYDVARRTNLPVPNWVEVYLDHVAKALLAQPGPTSTKAIVNALGFGGKGGPSKARLALSDQRQRDVAERVVALKNLRKQFLAVRQDSARLGRWASVLQRVAGPKLSGLRTDLDIMVEVASEYEISPDRVQAIYYKFHPPRKARSRQRRASKRSSKRRSAP